MRILKKSKSISMIVIGACTGEAMKKETTKIFLKSIEEMAELQKELAKLLNGEKRIKRARGEFKDVMFWLDKLKGELQ